MTCATARPGPWVRPIARAAGGLLLLLVLGVAAMGFWRSERIKLAEHEVRSLGTLNEALVARSVLAVELALQEVLHSLDDASADARLDEAWLRESLSKNAALLEYVRSIVVIDAGGQVRLDSRKVREGLDLSDRGYFRRHRDEGEPGPLVSGPLRSRVESRWFVAVSRAAFTTDGRLRHVVMASLDPAHFAAVWGGMELGAEGTVLLFADDGTLMMNMPLQAGMVGVAYPALAELGRNLGPQEQRLTRQRGPADGVERLALVRRVTGHPEILMSVGLPVDGLLASWRHVAWGLALAWPLACVSVMWALLVRLRAERQVRAYAALTADAPQPVWRLDHEGRVLYANRAARAMGQGRPEALLAHRQRAIAAARLPDGDAWQGSLDGRSFRFLAGRAVGGDGVNLYGVDVSALQRAENRLRTELERARLLHRITSAIGTHQEAWRVLAALCLLVERQLPADVCMVLTESRRRKGWRVEGLGPRGRRRLLAAGAPRDTEVPDDPLVALALQAETRVLTVDLGGMPQSPAAQRLAQAGLVHAMVVPMREHQRPLGLLLIARAQGRAFDQQETDFGHVLAQAVVLTLQQVRAHQAMRVAFEAVRAKRDADADAERLRQLAQMATGVANDINNALSPVALYLDSLLDPQRGLDAVTRQRLQAIQRAVDDVAATIVRMRATHREHGAGRAERIDTEALLRRMADASASACTVTVRVDPELHWLQGDEALLGEALRPLIDNAVEASAPGQAVALVASLSDEGLAHLEVVDQGPGMDAPTLRQCQEPYFSTKSGRGSGLGLPIAADAARRLGGRLEIISQSGRGTTARVVLASGPLGGGARESA